jgi:hypothetical protein
MKYIITESKMDGAIHSYLTNSVHPDYNWGPELHDFYRKDVKEHGGYEFEINDVVAYSYYNDNFTYKTLIIEEWLVDKLSTLFGNFWQPVFKKWFEENSGLKVKQMIEGEE